MAYYPYATEIGAIYTLMAPSGSFAVFNDDKHPYYAGMLTEVTGLDSPDVRESAEELAQADGGSHGHFWFGRRPITLGVRLFGHTSIAQRTARMDLARRASLALRGDSILSWKPSVRRENLVTNPRAMLGLTDWHWTSGFAPGFNFGGTLTRVTGVSPPVGTTAFQFSTTGSGNADQSAGTLLSLQAGKTYGYSFAYRRTAGTGAASLTIANQFVNTYVTTLASNLTASGWTVVSGTFTPLVTDSYAFGLQHPASNTNASTWQFSDVMFGEGAANSVYGDGDYTGWDWQGTPGASASGDYVGMFTYVRRNGPLRESGAWVKELQIPLVSEYAGLFSLPLRSVIGTSPTTQATGENKGSWPAQPIIRVTGPTQMNFSVTGGGGGIYTTGNLIVAGGEVLEIDTLNHVATFVSGPRTAGGTGNANSFINYTATIWPSMPTGNTTFTLSGTGTIEIRWRDTWM
jgi:hypothetical protein